jgi:predicted small lipoprotein YifL
VLFALDGGIDLKKAMLALIVAMVLVALTGCSMGQNPFPPAAITWPATPAYVNGYEESNRTFDFEQSVQGNGYFVTYLYARAGATAVKNYAHGSGSLNSETTLTYQNLDKKTHNVYSDYNDFAQDCIMFKEDVAMVYAPMRIAVGTGYYAANPLDYSSLLKEKTWVKNYLAGTSMHHEVEYAHALDKELEIIAKDKWNMTWDPEYESVGYTQMKIVEDVTDGKAHIGVLQADQNYANAMFGDVENGLRSRKSAWKNPSIEIDEDYWGTYHIEKNMTLEVPYHLIQKKDDWLPCPCGSAWDTMNPLDKKIFKSAAGIFDCTCFKAPTQAQFPRVYPVV